MASAGPSQDQVCKSCQTPQRALANPLKNYSRCHQAFYCNRECQKADWRIHKKTCTSGSTNTLPRAPDAHSPGFHTLNNLLGLSEDNYLHVLPEKKAFEQIMGCFRMRVDDEYAFRGNQMGIYRQEDPRPEFKQFLDLAESREGILPK